MVFSQNFLAYKPFPLSLFLTYTPSLSLEIDILEKANKGKQQRGRKYVFLLTFVYNKYVMKAYMCSVVEPNMMSIWRYA